MLNARGAGLYLICTVVSSVLIGWHHQLSIWRQNGPIPFEWNYLYSIDNSYREARVNPIREQEHLKYARKLFGGNARSLKSSTMALILH